MVGCVDEDNCFQLISVSFNKGKFEYTLPEDCSTDFADGFQYSGIERLMTINQLLDNGYSSKVAINDSIGSVMGYLSVGHFAKFGYEVAVHFAGHRSHSTLAMEHMFNNVLPPLLHDEEILLGITELKIGCLVWDVEVSKKQINELDFKLERSMIIHFPSTTVVTVFELSKRQ